MIDSLSLFLLATLAFITLTLIETSVLVLIRRFVEFNNYIKHKRDEEPCPAFPTHGREDPETCVPCQINRNEDADHGPKRIFLLRRENEQLHTSDKIDSVCFILFLTCYTMFVSMFMYSLTNA